MEDPNVQNTKPCIQKNAEKREKKLSKWAIWGWIILGIFLANVIINLIKGAK